MGNGEQYIWKPPEDDDITVLQNKPLGPLSPHSGENIIQPSTAAVSRDGTTALCCCLQCTNYMCMSLCVCRVCTFISDLFVLSVVLLACRLQRCTPRCASRVRRRELCLGLPQPTVASGPWGVATGSEMGGSVWWSSTRHGPHWREKQLEDPPAYWMTTVMSP